MSSSRKGKKIKYEWCIDTRTGKYSETFNTVPIFKQYCENNPVFESKIQSKDYFYILQMPKKCSGTKIKYGISTGLNTNNLLKRFMDYQKHYAEPVKILHVRNFDKRTTRERGQVQGTAYNKIFEMKIKEELKRRYGLPRQNEWIIESSIKDFMSNFNASVRALRFDDVEELENMGRMVLRNEGLN